MTETTVTLIPDDFSAPGTQGFILNGMPFFCGDTVWVIEPETGSKLYGTLAYVYGAAVLIEAPFVGNMWFKFAETKYRLSLVERGGKADAFGLAYYMREAPEGSTAWSELTEPSRWNIISAAAHADAMKIRTPEDPPYLSTDAKIDRYEQEES